MTDASTAPGTAARGAASGDLESPVVVKGRTMLPAEDFALLRKEGIEHIQRLGHRLWTDYNIHDPGITLLELACYAITDVGYRAGYDMADLLTDEVGGKRVIGLEEHQFHKALSVLTCHPVTFDDLRKRLVDVPGVRNAWVERNTSSDFAFWVDEERRELVRRQPGAGVPSSQNPPLNGLYDVLIEYEDTVATQQPIVVEPKDRSTGEYIRTSGRVMRLQARRALRLVAVSVYAQRPGTVVVNLRRSGATTQQVVHQVAVAEEKTRIPLDFELPAGGGYQLDCEGSTVELFRDRRARAAPADAPLSYTAAENRGQPTRNHYFFYDVEVDFVTEQGDDDPGTLTRQGVRSAVYDRIQADRNLGEDLIAVRDAATEEVALCADIELRPDADVEAVVAGVFARLRAHVSPAVDFFTIDELLDEGRSIAEIFEGPILDHGFIDDEQFRAMTRMCEIRMSDLIDLIMDEEGVVSVKNASLLSFVDGELRTRADWLLTLATDRYRSPVFSVERSKLVAYKDGLPYYPSRERLRELLEMNRPSRLRGKLTEHERDLPVPVGRARNVDTYHPMQHDLPGNYFAGPRKVPTSLGETRAAQSKQLKAYLMFFEQLLANYLAQLAHVGHLFSWDDSARRTYFTQPVGLDAGWATDVYSADVLTDPQAVLDDLVETAAEAGERRGRFLDHLIARFAEDFTEYSLLMYGRALDAEHDDVIADKRRFLEHYPQIGSRRATGFDYRRPAFDGSEPDNLTGLQRRVYGLLGIDDIRRRRFAGTRVTIIDTPDGRHRFQIAADDPTASPIFESISCESRESTEVLLDLALSVGGDRANYRAAAADGEGGAADHELVVRRGDKECGVIGTLSEDALDEVIGYFGECAAAEGFHVVEHVLLRPRRAADRMMSVQLRDESAPGRTEARDPYSFRVTVVLPSWPARFQNLNFRRLVERTLRAEAPAHVLLKICWISHDQMRRFEDSYERWALALADLVKPVESLTEREAATPAYGEKLAGLIEMIEGLVNVYPVARLHAADAVGGDEPAVTLNHTSLGTF